MICAILQIYSLQHCACAGARVLPGGSREVQRESDILECGQCLKQIEELEYEPDFLPSQARELVIIQPGHLPGKTIVTSAHLPRNPIPSQCRMRILGVFVPL